MRVLLTGASGFVGSALARRLVADGIRVRGTHRRTPPPIRDVEWLLLDELDDADAVRDLVADCDVVVHLAALAHQTGRRGVGRWSEFQRVNVEGTRCLGRAARRVGVARFVFISSVAACASQSEQALTDQSPCQPDSDYGRSKLQAEQALRAELEDGATDWCILRPPLVYGADNPGNMARLVRLIESGWPLPFGRVRNCRSFIYIDNLVDAIVAAIHHPQPIRAAFLVGDGSEFSTAELIRACARARARRARLWPLPVAALRGIGTVGDLIERLFGVSTGVDSYSVERLIGSLVIDSTRFRSVFGWQPPVDLQSALQATCAPASGRPPRR